MLGLLILDYNGVVRTLQLVEVIFFSFPKLQLIWPNKNLTQENPMKYLETPRNYSSLFQNYFKVSGN